MRVTTTAALIAAMATWMLCAMPATVSAHCDSLDGPVVRAAQQALDTRNVSQVLIWVGAGDEAEIRAAFDQTLAVRGLNARAKALADRYFFETVVRVHRAGEGAPYTGLKPAGLNLGPAIPAADRALADGSPDAVLRLLAGKMEAGLHMHFEAAFSAKNWKAGDVDAGRRFVKAYVEYIHYVEQLHEAMGAAVHGHFDDKMPSARW
jgi:uncharacterized protein DUF6448